MRILLLNLKMHIVCALQENKTETKKTCLLHIYIYIFAAYHIYINVDN